MKPLTIGQLVRVSAIAGVGYIDDRKRVLTRLPVEPFLAVVVGKVVKQLGQYSPARGGGFSSFGEDYDPAYLAVEGTVTLWQVRTGMVNKPILTHDDDLELSDDEFRLPNRGSRPKRIGIIDEVFS